MKLAIHLFHERHSANPPGALDEIRNRDVLERTSENPQMPRRPATRVQNADKDSISLAKRKTGLGHESADESIRQAFQLLSLSPAELRTVLQGSIRTEPLGRGKDAAVHAMSGFPALVVRGKKTKARIPNNPKALHVEYGTALQAIRENQTLGVPLLGIVASHSELAQAAFLTPSRALAVRGDTPFAVLRRCNGTRIPNGYIDAYTAFRKSLEFASEHVSPAHYSEEKPLQKLVAEAVDASIVAITEAAHETQIIRVRQALKIAAGQNIVWPAAGSNSVTRQSTCDRAYRAFADAYVADICARATLHGTVFDEAIATMVAANATNGGAWLNLNHGDNTIVSMHPPQIRFVDLDFEMIYSAGKLEKFLLVMLGRHASTANPWALIVDPDDRRTLQAPVRRIIRRITRAGETHGLQWNANALPSVSAICRHFLIQAPRLEADGTKPIPDEQ